MDPEPGKPKRAKKRRENIFHAWRARGCPRAGDVFQRAYGRVLSKKKIVFMVLNQDPNQHSAKGMYEDL
jgi:hypothetical protein